MRIWTRTNIRFQPAFISCFTWTDSDIIHKPWWVVWILLCFWKSLFLEPSRISNSITVRRKIAVKISLLSVVFQSNMTVRGQTDLWIVSNQPERPGGSERHELTSYLPLWTMLNSFVSFCPNIVVLILAWILKLMVWKTLTLSSKVAQFFTCAGQWGHFRLEVLVVLPS